MAQPIIPSRSTAAGIHLRPHVPIVRSTPPSHKRRQPLGSLMLPWVCATSASHPDTGSDRVPLGGRHSASTSTQASLISIPGRPLTGSVVTS